MKAKDLRERSVEDLRELEKSLQRDTFTTRLKNFTNRLDDTSTMRKNRRDLARVKTLLVEIERGIKPGEKKAKQAKKAKAAAAPAAKKAPAKKAEAAPKKTRTKKSEAK